MRTVFDRPWVLSLWLACIFVAGVALRVVPGHARVFPATGEPRVDFREIDPWYHVRAIEHQVANFPERFQRDPYLGFPSGGDVPVAPLFDFLAAAAVHATAWGPPTTRWTESVAAWLPAILGALLVWPVALLAWRLGGGLAAALAAPVAVLGPGQYLARSVLGFVDHHVLEVLLSTALLAALAGALDDRRPPRARVRSSVAAGAALAGFYLTWVGAAALVMLLVVWLVAEFAFDLAAQRPRGWLAPGVLPAFALAAAAVVLFYDGATVPRRNLVAALVALASAAGLALSERFGARASSPSARVARTALLATGGGLAVLALAGWLAPEALQGALAELTHFLAPGSLATTIFEAGPLSSLGPWWRVLWNELSLAGYLALVAVVVGLVRWFVPATHPARPESLMLLWSAGLVVLTLRQNRFLYYLVVPAAVASGVLLARVAARTLGESRGPRRSLSTGVARALIFSAALTALVGFGLRPAVKRAGEAGALSADWREAMQWLRASTPEPFGDATAYWRATSRSTAPLAPASYSVAAWWDYGYWILRLGHRVPAADPTQRGAREMARLLMAVDDRAAAPLLEASGARYLVLDWQLPMLIQKNSSRPSGKFRSLALWAGEPDRRYVERVLKRDASGKLQPATLFHADYYRTLLVRLYLYGGRSYEPAGPSYVAEFAPTPGGERELVGLRTLPSYRAGLDDLAGRDPERFAIVGLDPAVSSVPLAASALFRRVHGSPTAAAMRGTERIGQVEIYEHVAPPPSATEGSGAP